MGAATLHEITFSDKSGHVLCRVHYRSDGPSLQRRYKNFRRGFKGIVKPLATVDIRPDGSATAAHKQKILDRAEMELKKRINALLGVEEAESLFAQRRPFASVGGEFFCLQIIKGLAYEIERVTVEK